MPVGPDWSPRFAVFGDMGNINPQSLPRLQEETLIGLYDAILHVGDFAYDMATVGLMSISTKASNLHDLDNSDFITIGQRSSWGCFHESNRISGRLLAIYDVRGQS